MIPPRSLAFPLLERHPCWSTCGRRTRPFSGRAFRENRTNVGALPIRFIVYFRPPPRAESIPARGRPDGSSTALVERALFHRARSASKGSYLAALTSCSFVPQSGVAGLFFTELVRRGASQSARCASTGNHLAGCGKTMLARQDFDGWHVWNKHGLSRPF